MCLITIICLSLLSHVLVLTKLEKDVASVNDTSVAPGAIAYYDKALSKDPNNVHLLYNKGLTLDNLGNHTGAISYYDKALAIVIDPHDVYALTIKGVVLGNLGNYTGAIKYFDKALAIDPKDVYALDNKGLSLYKSGNYTGAIKYFDKALAKHSAPYQHGILVGLTRAV
jgi:tetratricopeptide (TPR) repeat protein